jgi:hypothetical protein
MMSMLGAGSVLLDDQAGVISMTLRRYAAVNHAFIALASSRFSTASTVFRT